MKYIPINDFLLIYKIETEGLQIAGQDDDVNATIHGIVLKQSNESTIDLINREVVFVRGQARKIRLDGEEFFIIKQEKVMLYAQNDS